MHSQASARNLSEFPFTLTSLGLSLPTSTKMPLAPMSDVEIETAVNSMDADLRLALSRNDVTAHVMAVLAKAWFPSSSLITIRETHILG